MRTSPLQERGSPSTIFVPWAFAVPIKNPRQEDVAVGTRLLLKPFMISDMVNITFD
jgi:hypothetical protein